MGTRDELLRQARTWSDQEATIALKAVERDRHAREDVAEEWGDVAALKAGLKEYDSPDGRDGLQG